MVASGRVSLGYVSKDVSFLNLLARSVHAGAASGGFWRVSTGAVSRERSLVPLPIGPVAAEFNDHGPVVGLGSATDVALH